MSEDGWFAAGRPMPQAAERVDSGQCEYECGNDADYRVQMDNHATFLCCQSCSYRHRIYAKENDLLNHEVTSADTSTEPGEK